MEVSNAVVGKQVKTKAGIEVQKRER